MQGNPASSLSDRQVSWFFLSSSGKLGYVLKLRREKSLKTFLSSATSGLHSSFDGHLRNLNYVGRTTRTLLEVRQETEVHFLVVTVILGFLSIFKKRQTSSPFEALNSMCVERYQIDVILPVQMRQRATAFSRISTGDSNMHSSCELKDEPEL